MKNNKSAIIFKPIEDKDITLMEKWLYLDHIHPWYHNPQEWIKEIEHRKTTFNFIHHFIVYDADKPFAFCQYYDCFYAKEDWYTVNNKGHTYSIDYLIGDKAYLGKGYGKLIVKLLIEQIRTHNSAARILVQPEQENIPSRKVLEANDFIYDDKNQCYKMSLLH